MSQKIEDKDRIRAALKELGLSQAAFAREIDVNPMTVTRWIDGTRNPRPIVLKYLDLRVQLHRLNKGAGA